ncbi:DUF327 family protein [Spirochaetota bacterium]
MIKITQTIPGQDNKTKVKGKKKMPKVGKGTSSFVAELENNIIDDFAGTIEELLDDLKDQEKRFLDKQSIYELKIYKRLIQKILKNIVGEAFDTKTLKKNRVKGKEHTIVDKINSKLLEITDAITKSNKAFNLLKSIEEIRGLILDLLY